MRRRGFTLVELLVVSGIIAVLISLLLPALNGARESARCVQCAANVRTIMQGWLMYANDNRGFLPACGDGQTWPGRDQNLVYYLITPDAADIEFEHGALMPYLSRDSVATRRSLMLCPAAQVPPSPNVSYVFGADLKPENGPKRITQIRHPSDRIPMVEQEQPDSDGNFDPDQTDDTGCVRHFRHGSGESVTGKGNYGFSDTHVETLTPQELHLHPEWVHLFR